jgi:putative transposase
VPASIAPSSPFRGYRFPAEIICYTVWLYHRFALSHRDVEELYSARCCPPSCGVATRGDKWFLDEVALMMKKRRYWLWRAVDQDGTVLDILVQGRRDQHAAESVLRH